MASRKVKKPKKRAQRATSNVFAMFAQDQIQVKYHMLSLKYANSNFIFLLHYLSNSSRFIVVNTVVFQSNIPV